MDRREQLEQLRLEVLLEDTIEQLFDTYVEHDGLATARRRLRQLVDTEIEEQVSAYVTTEP